jgi:hypothetical protein
MLDGVRHVGVAAVDPGVGQRPVEQLAGRTDERLADPVLLIAGLLADEHDPGGLRPLTEHGLGGRLPELAGPAPGCRAAQAGQAYALGWPCRLVLAHAPMTPHRASPREPTGADTVSRSNQ